MSTTTAEYEPAPKLSESDDEGKEKTVPDSNTSSTPAPASAPPTEKKSPKILVPEDSLLYLFVSMKADLDGLVVMSSKMTRTDYLIRMCQQAIENDPAHIEKVLLSKRWENVPWFLVPIADLSMHHYARFVYLFVNVAFNPTHKVGVSYFEKDSPNEVKCTFEEAQERFGWLHEHSTKLREFAKLAAPEWDDDCDHVLYTIADACYKGRITHSVFVESSIKDELARIKKSHTAGNLKDYEDRLRVSSINAMRALLTADKKTLKLMAKKVGIPAIIMFILSVEFDDMYLQKLHKQKKDIVREELAKSKAEDAATAAAAAAAAAVVTSATPVSATPPEDKPIEEIEKPVA